MEEWKSNVEFWMLNFELPPFKLKNVFLHFLNISCNSWFWGMTSERITWKKLVTSYYSLIFNPCFNGRCKRTLQNIKHNLRCRQVSILVLMEEWKSNVEFWMLNFELPPFKLKNVFLHFLNISCNSWFWGMTSERITWKNKQI